MANKATEFKKELKELLTKYNASIDFACDDCSDWHGITGERMTVSFRQGKTFKYDKYTLADYQSYIDASDL